MLKNKKYISAFIITLLLFVFYTWGIPAIVDLPKYKFTLEEKIYEKSGVKFNLGNPNLTMGIFPSVWIDSDEISVVNSDGSYGLKIESPKLKVKLFPLIFKKIEIVNITTTSILGDFSVDKNKNFKIGEYILKPEENDSKFELSRISLDSGPYNIFLKDETSGQKLNFSGKYISQGAYNLNKNIMFKTEGMLNSGIKPSDYMLDVDVSLPISELNEDKFNIEGDIKDFELASVSNYINILTDGLIQEIKGKVNFNAHTTDTAFGHRLVESKLSLDNLDVKGRDEVSRINPKGNLSANINFEVIDDGFDFKNTKIYTDTIDVSLNGKIAGISEKKPDFRNLIIEVKKAKLIDMCAILPWTSELVQDMDFYQIKKYGFYGTGEGKIRLWGKGQYPNAYGDIKLRNAYITAPLKRLPDGASVDLNFIGDKMNLNVNVNMIDNQFVNVSGFAKTDGSKYSELNIKSSESVDLKTAKTVLDPLHKMLKFKLGPLPVMDVYGVGSIDMRSAGKKIDPHLFGYIKFRNGTASFNRIKNLTLKNASGEILFQNTEVPFKITTGTINGQKAYIEGKSTVLGKLDVKAKTQNQNISDIMNVINSSPDLVEVQEVIKPFTKPSGKADIELNIYGTAKDAEQVKFNKDLFAKGKITFDTAKMTLKDTYLPLTDINGVVNFNNKNGDYDLTGFVRKSKLRVFGKSNDKNLDLTAVSDKFRLGDCLDLLYPKMILPYKSDISNLYASFAGKYNGVVSSSNIDYSKVRVNGNLLSNINTNNPIIVSNSPKFNINNGELSVNGISGYFNSNPYALSFTASNIYKNMLIKNAQFKFTNFNLASLNKIKNQLDLPQKIKSEFDNIIDISGNVDISGNIRNGKINSDANLENIRFIYKPFDSLVRIVSGKANIRNNDLILENVNSSVSSMPVYLNGKVSNINNPYLNLSFNAKPTQMFFDRFYNSKAVYPVKLKGDVNLSGKITGYLSKLRTNLKLDIAKNSSLYFMGASLSGSPSNILIDEQTVGTNPLSIIADLNVYPDKIQLIDFSYNQLIPSQNGFVSDKKHITASGDIKLLNNNIYKFNNFKIKTHEPTDARIFNIVLRKPTIKQGVFTSDLTINGTTLKPEILGYLNMHSLNISLLDSIIQDINLKFDKNDLNADASGVILTNKITANLKARNDFNLPYIIDDICIDAHTLDFNVITNSLNDLDIEQVRQKRLSRTSAQALPSFDPSQVIVKNVNVIADKILIKNGEAQNFKLNANIDENSIVNINNYSLNLANGTITGDAKYNLKTYDAEAKMDIKNADAALISENLLQLANQMYGTVTGNIGAQCNGSSMQKCIATLNGEGHFDVTDGRMPKLGSLEYLLKAGNLITGGITGVSINGIVDLVTPLKTGYFDKISGIVNVKNGIAKDLEIYSSGEDLNLYMTGDYNLANSEADMVVYGSLSKNFSTVLGKISNMSLQRLFNKIPGISINEINPKSTSDIYKIPKFDKKNVLRVFRAEIFGDINGTNYVKSFRWVRN